eukprot:1159175-Pelagomonas_calceolata.AAC.18
MAFKLRYYQVTECVQIIPTLARRSYAKGFAYFGALYSFNECVIEKYRAKHDRYNPMFAGCATGGMMAYGGVCLPLQLTIECLCNVKMLKRCHTTLKGFLAETTHTLLCGQPYAFYYVQYANAAPIGALKGPFLGGRVSGGRTP